MTDTLTEELKRYAVDLGFARVGAARASRLAEDAEHLAAWLKAGFQGSMEYLKESEPVRGDPTHPRMLAGAKSILALATPYNGIESAVLPGPGVIAEFARRRDYHKVLRKRLDNLVTRIRAHGYNARGSVDSLPVMERAWARLAGVGFIGKNCCLIAPGLGSYVFLSAIVTDAELQPDQPIARGCGECSICLDRCPTQALVGPRLLDARRCISYLTQKDGGGLEIDPRPLMGNWVFGCDACQQCCPHNRAALSNRQEAAGPDAASILRMDEAAFARFALDSPLRKAGRERLACNAAIALGNTGAREHLSVLQQAAGADPSPRVREQATWAIRRIQDRFGL